MEDSQTIITDILSFVVVRTQGMRLMRPEKSWRPIITVEVDKHHCHETIMGVDGQNPNLKERFELHELHNGSHVDIRVWHRSQTKKKAKKRILVASASHTLGELVRQQEKEHGKELELRLHCQSAMKRAISSRGRPQNGASILLRIRPPANAKQELLRLQSANDDWEASSSVSSSGGVSSTKVSEPPSMPPSPTDDTWPGHDGSLTTVHRQIRRRGGYHINSDDEDYSPYSPDEDAPKAPVFSDGESYCGGSEDDDRIFTVHPSILPQSMERIDVPQQDMMLAERVLASFSVYCELKSARTDSGFERVFVKLQTEWTYIGARSPSRVSTVPPSPPGQHHEPNAIFSSVNSAVFAIGPDAIFDVHSFARSAIAASSVSSGLGIATDAWFLLRYNWADLPTFRTRALDIFTTYAFFSLSARVPAFCLFASSLALMVFLGMVAFEVWPGGVLLMCGVVGVVMSLQFLVWGIREVGRGVGKGVRGVGRVLRIRNGNAERERDGHAEGGGRKMEAGTAG
ncbi:hypothetical protein C0995_003103 [Termitomyces sp. Mi166|nr:hypothetical protein C0995_003103 [Termitomyces sp. Mi166\